jgi:hypothetical protein
MRKPGLCGASRSQEYRSRPGRMLTEASCLCPTIGPVRRIALVAVILAAGCGGDDDGASDDPERFASPAGLASAFLESRESDVRTTSIVVERTGEAGPTATVTITLAGLFDDSVDAVRYHLEVAERDGAWRLVSEQREQRCAAGRGHQDFAPENCV